MFSEENGPKIGLKVSCLILITLMIGIGLAAIVPVVEESEGWEEYTSARQYSYGYYGRVTRSYSSSSGNTYSIYSGSQITIGRSYNSP